MLAGGGGGVSSGHFRLDDHHDQFAISTEAEIDANVRFRDSIQLCRDQYRAALKEPSYVV